MMLKLVLMTNEELKEANRLMWMVKGTLIPKEYNENDIRWVIKNYTERLWGNHEAGLHEDGFESAWEIECLQIIKSKRS